MNGHFRVILMEIEACHSIFWYVFLNFSIATSIWINGKVLICYGLIWSYKQIYCKWKQFIYLF